MSSFADILAEKLREWFPELEGRAVAVSNSDPFTPQTMPSLPLAIVALVEEDYGSGDSLNTVWAVEFMFPPSRYLLKGGGESPFWTHFDYTPLRDILLEHLPSLGKVRLLRMEMDSDPAAVYISFRIRRESRWCSPEPQPSCEPKLTGGGVEVTVKALPRPWLTKPGRPTEESPNGC